MTEELEHRIRQRAHEIWEREGHPANRAEAHWWQAADEVRAEDQPQPAAEQTGDDGPAPAAKPKAARKAAAATGAAPKRRSPAGKSEATK